MAWAGARRVDDPIMTIGPRRNWWELAFLGASPIPMAGVSMWAVETRGQWWFVVVAVPVVALCSWMCAVGVRQTIHPVVLTSSQLLYPEPYSFTEWHAVEVATISGVSKDHLPPDSDDFDGWHLRIDLADGSYRRIEVDRHPLCREHPAARAEARPLAWVAFALRQNVRSLQGPHGPMADPS